MRVARLAKATTMLGVAFRAAVAVLPVSFVALASPALLGFLATSHAEDGLAQLGVDGARLHVPLGDIGVLAFPGDLTSTYGRIGKILVGPVDADVASEVPAENAWWLRLRLSPTVTLVTPSLAELALFRFGAELDLLRTWAVVGEGRDALASDGRARSQNGTLGQRVSQLYVAAVGPHVQIQLGLVRSRWGLGVVSNAGEDVVPGTAESPFGLALQGDHVARAGVSLTPLGMRGGVAPLQAALAIDGVVDDDTASWSAGDRTYQVVSALSGRAGIFSGGLYVAHRWQRTAPGPLGAGDTTVTVLDATMKLALAEERGLSAYLEGEIATIRGSSSLAQSVASPGSFDVDQLGGALRFSLVSGAFRGTLEVGIASADENPFDDELRAFAFDRDYRVGLLLFREALMVNAAVGASNIADPDYRAEPPRGYERTATLGAVRGASYANPRVDFALLDGQLHLMAGFVYGASVGDYVDPFWSGIAGGAPRGPRNGSPADDLGWEIDLGLDWALDAEPIRLKLRVEGAYAALGDVFADASGRSAGDLFGVWAHVGVLW